MTSEAAGTDVAGTDVAGTDVGGIDVVQQIRSALAQVGDPERAAGQQRYMKSAMPYRGLTSAELKHGLRPILRGWTPTTRAEWEGDVRSLWDDAAYREERYAALALVKDRKAHLWLDVDVLPLLRHLIVTGAWWDLVDDVSTHPLRDALIADRARIDPVMRAWAVDEDLWLRRASVLCQVNSKSALDTDLLLFAVEANVTDSSFWLRKAIGWALRDHAHTDPEWVRAQVDRLGDRLSGLSRREATKHLS
ncbi:MAG: DNA alkylation repair protein [Ornithinimicrobium sp.]